MPLALSQFLAYTDYEAKIFITSVFGKFFSISVPMLKITVRRKTMRTEHDLLGERELPDEAYYGIQTLRAVENFSITGIKLNLYPQLIRAFAQVKSAAARANFDLGTLNKERYEAIEQACTEVADGKFNREFVVDMIQGGAGTSTNMNANEVIANRALELLKHKKGEYTYCHPNNHVNLSQSTNDAYPTAVKIALYSGNKP